MKPNSHVSVVKREGGEDEPLKQRPPSNPVVARRMIARALGKTIKASGEVNGSNRDYCQG